MSKFRDDQRKLQEEGQRLQELYERASMQLTRSKELEEKHKEEVERLNIDLEMVSFRLVSDDFKHGNYLNFRWGIDTKKPKLSLEDCKLSEKSCCRTTKECGLKTKEHKHRATKLNRLMKKPKKTFRGKTILQYRKTSFTLTRPQTVHRSGKAQRQTRQAPERIQKSRGWIRPSSRDKWSWRER